MHTMPEISIAGAISPQQITYPMAPSYTGSPRDNPKLQEAVSICKQEQCLQECYTSTGLKTFVDQ